MEVRLYSGEETITVELLRAADGRRQCRVGGREHDVEVVHVANQTVVALVDGRPIRAAVARDGAGLAVGLAGVVHRFTAGAEDAPQRSGRRTGTGRAVAPMPGKILNVLVRPGDTTAIGQPLAILEAMKMELTVTADVDGTVTAVHVASGDMVEGAQLLLEITPAATA
jgi:3-methylcrotonyl-CoA carboxylase alpha subunit